MDFVALNDAVNLAHRLKESAVFRNYLAKRLALAGPLVLFVLLAPGYAAATIALLVLAPLVYARLDR